MKKYFIFTLIFILGSLLILSQTVFASVSFSDVDEETDYYDSIMWMADNGVINGYGDGAFGPDNCVRRAEILKMLFEMLEVDESASNAQLFSDTKLGEWYTPYVRTARERGTVVGYSDGTFHPEQCVNRAEAIKMAVLEFNDGEVPEYTSGLHSFSDIDKNEWYFEYFDYAWFSYLLGQAHITISFPNTIHYYPEGEMSRKEVAEMLYRMKTIKDRGYDAYDVHDSTLNLEPDPIEREAEEVQITFDGCSNDVEEDYLNMSWYDDLIAALNKENTLTEHILEACYSQNGQMVILIAADNISCSQGLVYRYDIAEKDLELAEFDSKGHLCVAAANEFGQRVGNYIPITGVSDDTGVEVVNTFDYNFAENKLIYKDYLEDGTGYYCQAEPMSTDIGRSAYPKYPEYQHLEFLGQLFTAFNCGSDRFYSLDEVDASGNYTAGAIVGLFEAPDSGMLNVLEGLGFECYEEDGGEVVDMDECKQFFLDEEISALQLILLEPYADKMKSSDCYMCG